LDFLGLIPLLPLVITFLVFPLAAWIALRRLPPKWRMRAFMVVNVCGAFAMCFAIPAKQMHLRYLHQFTDFVVAAFAVYVLLLLVHYGLVRSCAPRSGRWPTVSFLFPIAILIAVKYLPPQYNPVAPVLASMERTQVAEFFVGISYMAFRLSHLALEVRNGVVAMPSLAEYMSFGFFVPTLLVGPINPYSTFRNSLDSVDRTAMPVSRSLLRLVIGFTKYLFVANLLNQLSYSGLLLDNHPHHWIDLPIAIVAFYLYLYCNFSGYCDMAIGAAGLLGIEVKENFLAPFSARNIQEFWSRWHITLSVYMRDMVFSPLSKALGRRFAPRYMVHIIAFCILVVFVLIGIWHGVGWNFAVFGLFQGVGVMTVHYYTHFLKKLGKQRYAAYHRSRMIHGLAICTTFAYVAASLFFFNDWATIRHIFQELR
jgi:D-alanyl-lipoteichoic acid acyltransferase DltB (MBOAT superfamily)